MKIGVIGATGKAGSMILDEALGRLEDVTAIVRNKAKMTNQSMPIIEKDLFDLTYDDVKDFDAIVDAFNAPAGEEEMHKTSVQHLIDILSNHNKPRLMVVGGAGSLFVDEDRTTRLMDTPAFPDAFMPTAKNMGEALALLEKSDIQWGYISPAADFQVDGVKHDEYQVSDDIMKLNDVGNSEISYADYAIAIVDEIMKPKHMNERFSVVSK